ncbi:TPA: fluoride efflux transporter CrcB [Neisseria meningitidis]|jgi:crcB protein|uniref:Fluoride-specific ion channel FluC n=2 Tax=Neisseria meningitidis TaxID=487 RepID=A0A0Y6CAK5_NEIME|nr:fluoride efflux transporter CrcB [Neisseria meningitidis]CCA44736.1 protein crcB homolog [Neisseria meningitidis alpha522]MBG8579077.1 fluoride efflux transporter CrcB [Neisseria meningitidis]MBG8593147.1 fluoride efflux transporter CrcB [Neisseria meningitidis]MBG8602810.1 fluoride efflux transporter CrcB [Neisseria meningitidis]MBG8603065.1 fluoride efflux transporter CrcB [Neisseria meningitidis]
MLSNIIPLSIGAALGATARWLLNLAVPASLSPATGNLFANWIGAFLIGIFAETVNHPQWKLLLITGFLGSLTTLSGFSLETVTLLQLNRPASALSNIFLHTVGSLLLTWLGLKIGAAVK